MRQDGGLNGLGELELVSSAAHDALVEVTRDDAAAAPWTRAMYIRAGERYTLRGIPDGAYTVVTSQGNGGSVSSGEVQRSRRLR